jgi:hypothetical protein
VLTTSASPQHSTASRTFTQIITLRYGTIAPNQESRSCLSRLTKNETILQIPAAHPPKKLQQTILTIPSAILNSLNRNHTHRYADILLYHNASWGGGGQTGPAPRRWLDGEFGPGLGGGDGESERGFSWGGGGQTGPALRLWVEGEFGPGLGGGDGDGESGSISSWGGGGQTGPASWSGGGQIGPASWGGGGQTGPAS